MQEAHSPKVKGRDMNDSNPGWIKKANVFMAWEENPEVNKWRIDHNLAWLQYLLAVPSSGKERNVALLMLSRSLPTPLSCCMSKLPILCHGSIAHPPVGSFSSYSFEPFLQLKISLFPLSFQRPHLHSYKALIFFPGQLMVIGVCVLPLCALKGPGPKAAPCTGC